MNFKSKFRIGYWNIGIIEDNIDDIMEGKSYKIHWMKNKYRDRFFADPFLYKVDSENYYFFVEELIFKKKKGTIVLLTVNKKTMKLIERKEIFDDENHLSYPNYEDGIIVPENYKSGGLYKFDIGDNPVKKELVLKIPLIDPTFVEYNNKNWLFATTKKNKDDPNTKLSIFYEKDGRFIPHKKNPVKSDICSARPGGKFFKYKNELFRPAQNSEHRYGENIEIMKIVRLDEEEYQEVPYLTISSHESERYNLGLHTFNVCDGFIVVDGFEYSTQIIQKIRNKIEGY